MNERVLVVDDEEAIVDGLLCLLEAEQIEGAGAFDRQSAETLMEDTFFSVIVADIRLHTESEGLELLDGIRRISPRSRVVTLTGFSTPELDEEVLRRGAVMVIRKPAGGLEILEAISRLLAEVERLATSQDTLDFEALHLGLKKLLHSIPRRRYGLTNEEAEEVVQQAWLLFFENREVIRKVRPWLMGTVANLCKQRIGLISRRRETFVDDQELAQIAGARVENDTEIALRQAMALLDGPSRDLCQLIAVEGYAYDEVSERLKLPLGSIGPMYIRAKAKMRMQMAA
jgi:DNA-directed RNA polymerase specialized sigma24 family protein/CheY-like chemotaxis protein